MDIFAGSEPRLFISFRLENETTGQPAQDMEEKMDTSSPNLVRREAVEEFIQFYLMCKFSIKRG